MDPDPAKWYESGSETRIKILTEVNCLLSLHAPCPGGEGSSSWETSWCRFGCEISWNPRDVEIFGFVYSSLEHHVPSPSKKHKKGIYHKYILVWRFYLLFV